MSWVEGFGWQPNDPNPLTHGFTWMKQVSEAEKGIQSENLPLEAKVDVHRYIGYCYLQASCQSGSEAEFTERMRKAADSFHIGASTAKSMNDNQSIANAARLSGIEEYCLAQLTSETAGVLEHLHRAFDLLTQSLESQDNKTVSPFPSLPLEIVSTTNDIFNYEAHSEHRLATLRKSLHATESLEEILLPLTEDLRMLLLTELCELCDNAWISFPEYDQREKTGQRAIELMERVRQLAQQSTDPRVLVAAYALQTESGWLLPTDPPVVSAESLAPRIEATADRVAIGSFLAAHFRRLFFSIEDIEDLEKAKRLFEEGNAEATRAISELKAFRGLRRSVSSVGYVYWTQGDWLVNHARFFSDSPEDKRKLVREGVEVSRKVGPNVPPAFITAQYSNLGFYVYELALLEPNMEKRQKILEEAYAFGLKYEESTRTYSPFWEWGDAVHFRVYGRIKRELARISSQNRGKELEDAVAMYEKAAGCIQRIVTSPLSVTPDEKNRSLAGINYELGMTQVELYQQSRDRKILESGLKNLRQSAEAAANLSIPTRAGESLARIGEALLAADRFEEARAAFAEASQRYREAGARYPGLMELFEARAQLIQSRAIIADALGANQHEAYLQASKFYHQASDLLRTVKPWSELAPLYDAWGLLAEAESLSNQDVAKTKVTIEAAIRLFAEAEKIMGEKTRTGQFIDQATLQAQHSLFEQGRKYAETRLMFENARVLQQVGKLSESAEKLGEVSKQFDELSGRAIDAESQDFLRAQATLCHASQVMLEAENSHNPNLYSQASSLFLEAQKTTRNRTLTNSAGGWAACCKALELGILYRQSAEKTIFETLKKQLSLAHGYFVEAGAATSATWVMATQRMFDAIAYLAEAEASLKPEERKILYEQAEQNLQMAAEMFERTGFTSRREDAVRHLKAMMESNASLGRMLPTPPLVQSVSGIANQTVTPQILAGGELTSSPPLQVALKTPEGPLRVGHESELVLTVLNTSQKIALLDKVESLECPDLEIRSTLSEYPVIEGNLQIHEKRLPSLAAWQLPLVIRPRRAGTYTLQPLIIFTDPQGQRYVQNVALFFEATEMGVRGWLKGPTK